MKLRRELTKGRAVFWSRLKTGSHDEGKVRYEEISREQASGLGR
jgi:hypothetical protein